jgi:ABC-2 type transport system permease protein/capsular polysaccharide transport system permease protein
MPSSKPSPVTGVLLQSSAWSVNRRVLGALLIREMLTRYGRNNIGFLWLFVEPIMFMIAITAFWSATRSIHGSTIPITAFALTGYSSVLLWRSMVGRCINAVTTNRALLYHRQVTIIDVYFARILLEILAISTSFVAIAIALYAMGWTTAPENVLDVIAAWGALCWFGAALALTIGGLAEKYPVVGKLWPPLSFILFAVSGVGFLVDALPKQMQDMVLLLPMVHVLEFLRDGWFGSAFVAHYDMQFVLLVNVVLTFVGLSLVRQIGKGSEEDE